MNITSLRALMGVLRERPRIEILAHRSPEHIGEVRRVTIVQPMSLSFYSVIDGQPEHPVSLRNRGKGTDTWLRPLPDILLQGDVCTVYDVYGLQKCRVDPSVFIKFRILEE